MWLGLGLGLGSSSSIRALAAPVNVTAPTISGSPITTQTLTVSSVGFWTGYPAPAYTYQWQMDTAGNGTYANIGGATSTTLLLSGTHLGNRVRVRVSASNSEGSAGPAASAATTVVVAADTSPTAFTFIDITNADQSAVYTSNAITVGGINLPATISITGGTYSVNGGTFTSSSGTVSLLDTVAARVTSSSSLSTGVSAIVTIGGVSDTYTVTTTAADTTPDAFTFTDVTSATRSTAYISNSIPVAGINGAATISVTGGTYKINSGSYTASSGTVVNGDIVTVQTTSSGSYATAVNVVLTIGGVSDTYTVTTELAPADTTPDAFTLTDITDAALNTIYTASLTVSGINAATAISVSGAGAFYKVGSGSYTTTAGTVVNGDDVTVRATSSASYSTAVNTTLTIGGVSDTFTITTMAEPTSSWTYYFLGF